MKDTSLNYLTITPSYIVLYYPAVNLHSVNDVQGYG